MQLFLNARQPVDFLLFDRIHGNAGPARDDVFDVGLGHNAHAGRFADIEFLTNIAQVFAFKLLLVFIVLGLLEILAGDCTLHPGNNELDTALDVGHFRRQRRLA